MELFFNLFRMLFLTISPIIFILFLFALFNYLNENDYSKWSDIKIASIFIILITKRNFYNDKKITRKYYDYNYNLLKGYIDWKINNKKCKNKRCNKIKKSPYKYSNSDLKYIFNRLNYDVNNENKLIKFWKKRMCIKKLIKNNLFIYV